MFLRSQSQMMPSLLKCVVHACVALYLLDIPSVNNLTVCHPRRQPGPFCLSARTGAQLETQTDFFYAKIVCALLIRALLSLIKAFPNDRSSSSEEAHCVIMKTTYLRRGLLTLVNTGLCTDALQEEKGRKKKSGHAFKSITMQDNTTGFLPTVAPLGDVISKQSINPKKNNLIAIS